MILDHTSYLDLYFYAEMTRSTVGEHRHWLHSYLGTSMGETWYEDLDRDVAYYRTDFDILVRTRAETSDAIRSREQLMAKISTWRSMMTSMARQAPASRRKVLLQAAGHGLGSPSTVHEMENFLTEVKARLNLHGDSFFGLGARSSSLQFPTKMLAQLDKASTAVPREKAEESLARAELNDLHTSLVDRFEKLSHAASAAATQGALLDDRDMAHSGQDLLLHLTRAMGEAKIEAQRRSVSGEIPVELMIENTTIAPTGEIIVGPDSEVTGNIVGHVDMPD